MAAPSESELQQIIKGEQDHINEDIPMEECLDHFFAHFNDSISQFSHFEHADKKLNYLLMKRFIFTAYNNLVEMDHTIAIGKVSKPKRQIENVRKQYEELQNHIKKPLSLNFEKFYLSKQSTYNKIRDTYESKKSLIETYNTNAATINMTLRDIEKEMRENRKNKKRIAELEARHKKLNSNYVDTLQVISELKEQVTRLASMLEEYKKRYYSPFNQIFRNKTQTIADRLLNILDGIAYDFDTLLWMEAKGSEIIRSFFRDSKIQGSFSSKTYLKYFLKNLDDQNLSEEYGQMLELSNYLDEFSSRNIFILGEHHERIYADKEIIEAIDKDYTVIAETNPDKLIVEHQRKALDIIIIDNELRNTNGIEMIEQFWENFPNTKERVSILLRFYKPTYDILTKAGKMGIKHFQRMPAEPFETKEKFLSII